MVAKVTITQRANLYEAFAGTNVETDWGLSLAGTGKLVSGGIASYDAAPATWQGLPGTMLSNNGVDVAFVSYAENVAEDTITYTYWFVNTVAAESAFTLFEQVNVPSGFDNKEMALINGTNIQINAYAVQSVGFDNAKSAYEAAEF